MMQIRTSLLGLFGTSTSFGSVVVAQHVAGWLQVIAIAVGIVSGVLAIYWMDRLNSAKVRQINFSLCEICRKGPLPRECLLPPRDRPKDCPMGSTVGASWITRAIEWLRTVRFTKL